MIKFEKSSLLYLDREDKKEVIVLVTDKASKSVVVHSNASLEVGDTVNLNDVKFLPFVGTVHLDSKESSK